MINLALSAAGAAMLLVAASSSALAGPAVKTNVSTMGYAPGALADAEILKGDYTTALARLAVSEALAVNDPARLINLGNAYAGMGRAKEAAVAYRAALDVPSVDLTLADGSVASSRIIARRALRALPQAFAAR